MPAEPETGHRSPGDLRELLNTAIPADPNAVAGLTDRVGEVLEGQGVPEQKRFEIGLAVQEALANAVVHGCRSDPSKRVECRCNADPDGRILIVVTDSGPGFQVEKQQGAAISSNLYADHGRGVYLIRQLMDDVEFHGRGNEVRMWKY
jgi:serine/threonine-protein kinase RsbW